MDLKKMTGDGRMGKGNEYAEKRNLNRRYYGDKMAKCAGDRK